ncbi:hypothetical protein D3C83_39640 [compost metagenome]
MADGAAQPVPRQQVPDRHREKQKVRFDFARCRGSVTVDVVDPHTFGVHERISEPGQRPNARASARGDDALGGWRSDEDPASQRADTRLLRLAERGDQLAPDPAEVP